MDDTSQRIADLLSNPGPESLKYIEEKAGTKQIKQRIAAFIVEHRDRLAAAFRAAGSVDQQLALIRIVLKVFTKKQLRERRILGEHGEALLSAPALNKDSLRRALLRYNNANGCAVIGCRVARLVSAYKSLELSDGLLFVESDGIRIYGGGHAIVVLYRSIETVRRAASDRWTIYARENKTVELLFVEDDDYLRVSSRVFAVCGEQNETEDSITLSVEEYRSEQLIDELEIGRLPLYEETCCAALNGESEALPVDKQEADYICAQEDDNGNSASDKSNYTNSDSSDITSPPITSPVTDKKRVTFSSMPDAVHKIGTHAGAPPSGSLCSSASFSSVSDEQATPPSSSKHAAYKKKSRKGRVSKLHKHRKSELMQTKRCLGKSFHKHAGELIKAKKMLDEASYKKMQRETAALEKRLAEIGKLRFHALNKKL
ncbi:hypothetical protein PAPHI01_1562 [Pancytospora philotis]|nr:hypothetical protein PAPHI01_1545 [Pancytospora philotis]KAI4292288.1 hypothetical protein PAPHI01_1562 [Pancytospora philotis]